MTVSCRWRLHECGRGVNSMMVALLVAGIGLLLAGLAAIGFGIPVQEFSFGNTLILAGSVTACTGIMLLGLWIAVRELARRLGSGVPAVPRNSRQAAAANAAPGDHALDPFGRGEPALENRGNAEPSAPSPAPWQDEAAARERGRDETPSVPEPAETAPPVKPRRNLLFSSSSRKERERAESRAADPSALELHPAPPVVESNEVSPPATFDDAWPQSDRAKTASAAPPPPPPLRSSRAPSTFTEPNAAPARADRYPPVPRNEDQAPVTVLKSGVVDGMAYSLYSDGSIEAQMPEGMMRFASIDELRSHLDHRP
jgi:hypothetical protein